LTKKSKFAAKLSAMADHHMEPEENEIAGPVVFALMLLAIIVTIIYFWSK